MELIRIESTKRRKKYIDFAYCCAIKAVIRKEVDLVSVPTTENDADELTKLLEQIVMLELVGMISIGRKEEQELM